MTSAVRSSWVAASDTDRSGMKACDQVWFPIWWPAAAILARCSVWMLACSPTQKNVARAP